MNFEDFLRRNSTMSEKDIKAYSQKNAKTINQIDKVIKKVKKIQGGGKEK